MSYHWGVDQPVCNNFLPDHGAEVAQQVEPGADGCGGRAGRGGREGMGRGAGLHEGRVELREEGRPLLFTQGRQPLHCKENTAL